MTNGILLNGSADIDFMIHGVFPYQFFGQTGGGLPQPISVS